MSYDKDRGIITIKRLDQLRILELWLQDRQYNQVFPYLEDRFGNRMIGLNWAKPEGHYEKRGLIVITDLDVLPEAVEICEKGKTNVDENV